MLRDVTYTFWSENRVQDCAVRPVAMTVGHRKVIWPVIMATGRRTKRSKVKGHVGTAIQHSYLGRNQAASWPWRCAPRSGFTRSGPHPHAGLLISQTPPKTLKISTTELTCVPVLPFRTSHIGQEHFVHVVSLNRNYVPTEYVLTEMTSFRFYPTIHFSFAVQYQAHTRYTSSCSSCFLNFEGCDESKNKQERKVHTVFFFGDILRQKYCLAGVSDRKYGNRTSIVGNKGRTTKGNG